MAKLKKGSPEAKAWGRKMKALRSQGKPKSRGPRGNSMAEKPKKNGKRKMTVHLIPDALIAGGVISPSFDPNTSAGNDFWGALTTSSNPTVGTKVSQSIVALKDEYTSFGNLLTAAELIVGGIVVKWIGKKTGMNRIGTKEVKLL